MLTAGSSNRNHDGFHLEGFAVKLFYRAYIHSIATVNANKTVRFQLLRQLTQSGFGKLGRRTFVVLVSGLVPADVIPERFNVTDSLQVNSNPVFSELNKGVLGCIGRFHGAKVYGTIADSRIQAYKDGCRQNQPRFPFYL